MNDDGSTSLVWSSPDLGGNLATTMGWQQVTMPGLPIDSGEIMEVQFRGTNAAVAGITLPYPAPIPGIRPYAPGSVRAANSAPASIATATRDSMYSPEVPWVSIGIDVGQTQVPRYFFDDFNRASFGARWVSISDGLRIRNNRVYSGAQILLYTSRSATYVQPLVSDAQRASFDLYADDGLSGVFICGDTSKSGIYLLASSTSSQIITGVPGSGGTVRATAAGGSGNYSIEYDPDTKIVTALKNGDPLMTWEEPTGTVSHGPGHRWVGIRLHQSAWTQVPSDIDNFVALDVVPEEPEEDPELPPEEG